MKRKYASEAERKAAKVEARRAARAKNRDASDAKAPVEADASDASSDASDAKTVTPIEAVTPKPVDAQTEQWRLDAQEYMRTGRLLPAVVPTPGFVAFKDCPDVPHDPKAPPWLGAGRGVVREFKGKGYVLVARHRGPLDVDALEHGVVTADDHAARLNQRCQHKRAGWACHAC